MTDNNGPGVVNACVLAAEADAVAVGGLKPNNWASKSSKSSGNFDALIQLRDHFKECRTYPGLALLPSILSKLSRTSSSKSMSRVNLLISRSEAKSTKKSL
jgi:hypothetical protein